MADSALQSGRLSGLGGNTQGPITGYATPAHLIRAMTFDTVDDPQRVVYESLNQSLAAEDETRSGVHRITARLDMATRSSQGMFLWKAAIGQDILTSGTYAPIDLGAIGTAITTASATTPVYQIALAAAPAAATAAPAGSYSWAGCFAAIGASGSTSMANILADTTATFFPIWSQAGTALVSGFPITSNYATTAHVYIIPQHQFLVNTGANRALLDLVSLTAQYGSLFERRLADTYVSTANLRGDNERLTQSFDFASSAPVVQTSSLTASLPADAGEAQDSPFIQRDGGLITYMQMGSSGSTTPGDYNSGIPLIHNRLTALDQRISYALQSEKLGGGVQTVEAQVLGRRTHALTWTDLAGQNNAQGQFKLDFVDKDIDVPMMLAYRNPKSGYTICIWYPRVDATKYDPVGPTDRPLEWNGAATPLPDYANTGLELKMAVYNARSSVY